MFELPGAIEKLPGSTEVRKRLLDQGVAYLDSLAPAHRWPGSMPSSPVYLAMASKSAATEVQTQHRRRACAYVQESRTHLNRLPNPAAGFGARYPWSASTAETLRRTAEHCDSRGMTPSAHAPEPCRDNSNSNPRAMPS